MITLIYPDTFTSTQTFQNSNFPFPHTSILAMKSSDIAQWFYNDSYILPAYIKYIADILEVDNNAGIIDLLKNEPTFTTLGISFMKFKGLEEQIDYQLERAKAWLNVEKSKTHKLYNDINNAIVNLDSDTLLTTIAYILTIIQLMIINIVSTLMMDNTYPTNMIDETLNTLLVQFNQLTVMDLDVSMAMYLLRVIPLIYQINDDIVAHYVVE